MRTIHDGGGTKMGNGIYIFSFLAFSNYRTSVGYIFWPFLAPVSFLLSTNWEIFLVIFLLAAVKISCPLSAGVDKSIMLKTWFCATSPSYNRTVCFDA